MKEENYREIRGFVLESFLQNLGMDNTLCGILQAKILEWVAVPISRESSQPRY